MTSNRATTICLLLVLEKYSDENHIMSMQEIQLRMRQCYDITVDRRTIYSAVELLQQLGYDISTYEENGRGYYLQSRVLEAPEVQMLMDAVVSFPFITGKQSDDLLQKLKSLGSIYQVKSCRHLLVDRAEKKTKNRQVFLNIEQIDEAIENKMKVSFTYLMFNAQKKMVPRREKPYTVNPISMLYTNERYYLVCTLSGYDNISLYRIDRMKDLAITDEPIDPVHSDAADTAAHAVYAFTGKPERVSFLFDKAVLDDVIDRFGAGISLLDAGERYSASVIAAPRGIKFWALQYLPYVEVTEPVWLREEIIDSIKRNPYREVNNDVAD